jgi:hypothetical protein
MSEIKVLIQETPINVNIAEEIIQADVSDTPIVFNQLQENIHVDLAPEEISVSMDGGTIQYINRTIYYEVDEMPLSKKIDWVGDNAFYKGEADPGTGSPELKWRIKYVEFLNDEGDLDELWANGTGSPVHSWTLRASYPYS